MVTKIFSQNCLLFLLFTIVPTIFSYGQTDEIKTKTQPYSVFAITNHSTFKGDLMHLNANTLAIKTFDNLHIELQISDIQLLKFRRKGNIGKGMLIGALTGMSMGALIGFLSGDDPEGTWVRFTAKEKAVALGGFLAIPGVLTGGIIGSKCIKIPIENKQSLYNKQLQYLKRFER